MGHKSITMTVRYAHLSPKHRTKALEKLCASATKHSEANQPVAVNVSITY